MSESLQAAFDKACAGVIAQGCKSRNVFACAYRGVNKTKCAVGQLISDEQMRKFKITEGMNPGRFPDQLLQELCPEVASMKTKSFLLDMQSAHDVASNDEHFLSDFKDRANAVARTYGLKEIV